MNYAPKSIELLFENFKLDVARCLVIIHAISDRRKKIKIQEYIFYEIQDYLYTRKKIKCKKNMLNYYINRSEDYLYNNEESDNLEGRYIYFKISNKLPNIILYLNNMRYIEVHGKGSKDIFDLDITITDKGRKLLLNLQGNYYKKLFDNIINIKSKISYSKTAYKEILEAINEWN